MAAPRRVRMRPVRNAGRPLSRRSSSVLPPNIGSYIRLWAGDPLWTPPADGAGVSSWRNAGSLGTAAVQATGGDQPIYRSSSSIFGGRSCVDFVSSDKVTILSGVSLPQPYTVTTVASTDAFSALQQILSTVDTTTGQGLGVSAAGVLRLLAGGTAIVGSQTAVNTAYVITAVVNGASSAILVNGVSVGTGDMSTTAMNQLVVGSGHNSLDAYGNPFDGKVAFVDVVPGAATTLQGWAGYISWLREHYGLW